MLLPHNTVVAVVDGEHLNLFVNKGNETRVDLVIFDTPPLNSTNAGSGLRHHHEAANPDADRKHEDAHTAAAAQALNKFSLDNTVSKLVIVADPRTLGELRRHYHPALSQKLLAEISKDLVGSSAKEIGSQIQKA